MAKSEGISSWWKVKLLFFVSVIFFKGSAPNVYRAALMSVGQLTAYDQAKQILLQLHFKDNTLTHFK